jgi:mitochondrial import inner membrane translocase subunit TIM23
LIYSIGLSVGGAWGLYEGVKQPIGSTFRLKLNSALNSVTRRGPFVGNSAGVMSLMYTTIDHILGKFRDEDLLNHAVAGAVTGALFKSTSGARTAGKAAVVLGVGALAVNGIIGFYKGDYASNKSSDMYA